MADWIVRAIKAEDGYRRAASFGLLLTPFAKAVFDAITKEPRISPGTQLGAYAIVGLVLFYVTLIDTQSFSPKTKQLRPAIVSFACFNVLGSILYFLSLIAPHLTIEGYDSVTDYLSTASFVIGWIFVTNLDCSRESRQSDRLCILFLSFLITLAFVTKFCVDIGLLTKPLPNAPQGRLFLNYCNGAIFFGLYVTLRRLFSPPDQVSHLLIVLFGASQIAAGGRACLEKTICTSPSFDWMIATLFDWSLLIGKIAFGAYLLYLYIYGIPRSETRSGNSDPQEVPITGSA